MAQKGCPEDIDNPRLAAERWFGIKDGKLRTIDDATDRNIQSLARKIRVTLKDSEREDFPTVEVRDHGTGIRGEDFSKTILSLNDDNKIDDYIKWGLMGKVVLQPCHLTPLQLLSHDLIKFSTKGIQLHFR
ncbi:MAG: hypothetical protein R2764_20480 [Bacteroidales bacterium]